MRLRTTLATTAAVVGLGVLSFGGVSLAQTGDGDAGGGGATAEATPTDLDGAWEALESCLDGKMTEPAENATDEEWEAFEATADAAWEECIPTLTPEQQAAIEADEEVWADFEACVEGAVEWDSEPGDAVAESEWRKFDEHLLTAEKACADQLPEDARIEFGSGIADEEAWMAFEQCLTDQGVPAGEPSLDAPHSDWLAFEGQWEVAEGVCADLLPEDEWCDGDHTEGEEGTEPDHDESDGEEAEEGNDNA